MTEERRWQVSSAVAATVMLSVLLVGAGGTYVLMRGGRVPAHTSIGEGATTAPPPSSTAPAAQESSAGARPGVVVALSKDAADRAGIEVTRVTARVGAETLRLPGIVEPNAYRHVTVTSLVGGRIVRVSAQLGDRVRKGQAIAQIYSADLAEARTKYVAAKTMLEAHDRELQRTEKLVEIGAASRQELERIHAEHAAQTAEVESARSRLQLLGVDTDGRSPSKQENATTNIPAPMDGVVVERLANVGLNVDPTTKLFTVVDLSNVWVVADVYERDLRHVREGARANVTIPAYPDRPVVGRVSFIDPQLNVTARTARIRVDVANPRGDLRLGMYTNVEIELASERSVPAVPKGAVQDVGGRQVVYVLMPNDPEKFVERDVQLGRTLGDLIEVVSGLSAGESVVSKGSFFVRAEAERLGLRRPDAASSTGTSTPGGSAATQTARIAVTEKGFAPDTLRVQAGSPARFSFVRTTDNTCATEVAFPLLNIKRTLPLNEPVSIEFTPTKSGEIAFVCGVNMLKGVIVVQ